MIDIFSILFAVFCLAVIFAVGVAVVAVIAWMVGDDDMPGLSHRSGDGCATRPVPMNGPPPTMTAPQNAFQNTHGATALNAARNARQTI